MNSVLFIIVLFAALLVHEACAKAETIAEITQSIEDEEIGDPNIYDLTRSPMFNHLNIAVRNEYLSVPIYLESSNVGSRSVCVLALASRDLPPDDFLKLHELLFAEWKSQKLSTELFSGFIFRCGMRQNGRLQNLHRNERVSALIDSVWAENVNRSNELTWLTPEFIRQFKSGYFRRILRAEKRLAGGELSAAFLVLDDTNEVAKYGVSELAVEKIKENYYLWYLIGAIFIGFTLFSAIRRKWIRCFAGLFGATVTWSLAWGLMVGLWVFPV